MASKNDKKLTSKQKNRKLFLGMFLSIVTLAILVCTFFGIVSGKISRYYVRSEALRVAENLSAEMCDDIQTCIDSINIFANFAKKNNDVNALSEVLTAVSKDLEYADSFYYATIKSRFEKGGIYLDSDKDFKPEPSWEPRNFDWFKDTISANGEIVFQEPEIDETDNSLSMTIAKAVLDSRSKPIGIVGTDILMEDLSDFVDEFKIAENTRIFIVTSDGTYITNPDASKIMNANYFDETKAKIEAETYFSQESETFSDTKTYYAYSKIGISPWYVVIEGDINEFTSAIHSMVYVVEVFALLFALVASFFNLSTIRKLRKDEQLMGQTLFEDRKSVV